MGTRGGVPGSVGSTGHQWGAGAELGASWDAVIHRTLASTPRGLGVPAALDGGVLVTLLSGDALRAGCRPRSHRVGTRVLAGAP